MCMLDVSLMHQTRQWMMHSLQFSVFFRVSSPAPL